MSVVRVVVTGSRRFPAAALVRVHLDTAFHQLLAGDTLTVVHGTCRTGADAAAAVWCAYQRVIGAPVVEEPHAADWATHGRAAGPLRNAAMVAAGADMCLAFLDDTPCRGTHATIHLARAAGIDVTEVTQ